MRKKLVAARAPCISLPLLVVLLIFGLVPISSFKLRHADADPLPPTAISPTPEGAGSLRTIVTPNSVPTNLCGGNCVVTGGTRIETNLFHSFGQFNVGSGDITTFQNGISFDLDGNQLAAGLLTFNILGRITGGNSSTIFGTIQTTGFGNANLFLMNPNGFLFGPNATVNIGGMATFTTANSMRLTDSGRFNANPNGIPIDVLIAAPVVAFGFLGSNPAAIDFAGGQLTVASGTGLALVGGDIHLIPDSTGTPSSITAPGKPIQLTSVAGDGIVAADTGGPEPGMALGTITLGQGTNLSTAGDASFGGGSGGPVSIRGGQLVATGATIITSPADGSIGSGGKVTISVTGSAAFTDSMIQTKPADFSFGGTGEAVSITADASLTMTNTTINTSTFFAGGDSGPVTLKTNGSLSLTDSSIITSSSVSGDAAAITVKGGDVSMSRGLIDSSVEGDPSVGLEIVRSGVVTVTADNTVTVSGSSIANRLISTAATKTMLDASPVIIKGKTVILSNGMIDTSMSGGNNPSIISPGNGGAIEIHGNTNLNQFVLNSNNSGSPESTGAGGSIRLMDADSIQLTASRVTANAGSGGGGGDIEFLTNALTISDHTDVGTSSFGQGAGGTITVKGAENVTIESGSRVLTDVVVNLAGVPQRTAGNILIETQNLTLQGGGHIRAGALPLSTGDAANITVQGTSTPAESVMIDGSGSGIFTDTQGTGAGGNITLNANVVTLQNGGTLSAKTSGTNATATGGSITVNAADHVTMTNGASVTASSTGPGDAGDIKIDSGQSFVARNSEVTTRANLASGGDIKIATTPNGTVELTNSKISASVADGSGGGGNISIDPQYVILQGSQILAQAADGQGGAITITTNLFLPDAFSLRNVNADSGRPGLNGTVTIQSPNSPGSGEIHPLGNTPLEATSLLNQRCAALAGGQFSSFTVAGRDILPAEPGTWLASPLASLNAGTGLGVNGEWERSVARGEGVESVTMPAGESTLLSLRQVAPAGFLTQAFAVDWSAGCQS